MRVAIPDLTILLIIATLFSCGHKSPQSEPVKKEHSSTGVMNDEVDFFSIDLNDIFRNVKKEPCPFSSFANSIEYIPLETTLSSLVGGGEGRFRIRPAALVSNKIILVDMKCFNRQTGSYLRDIMEKGEGGQEYIGIKSAASDDEREEFYLLDETKRSIFIVGYDGTFKKSIPCSGDMVLLNLGNGNLLVGRDGSSLHDTYDDFYVVNIDTGEIVLKKRSSALASLDALNSNKNIYRGNGHGYWTVGCNLFWNYEDKVRYYDHLTDSVFTITKNLQVLPTGSLLMDNIKLTKEQAFIRPFKRDFVTWKIGNVVETSGNIIISMWNFVLNPSEVWNGYILVCSKNSNEIVAYHYSREEEPFKNDLDNTVYFYPNQVQNSSSLYGLIPIDRVKERADEAITEKGKSFKEMADKLKFDDNEVIGILK